MFLFYSAKISQEQYQMFADFMAVLSMQPNELSLTTKITIMLIVALQKSEYVVFPFVNLNVPESRKGHPYMMDIMIEENTFSSSSIGLDNASNTLVAVKYMTSKNIIAMVEVKRSVNVDLILVEPKTVIETIVYIQYMISLHDQHMLIGIITDGSVWHCLQFSSQSESIQLSVHKYMTFIANEIEVMGILPQVLRVMSRSDGPSTTLDE